MLNRVVRLAVPALSRASFPSVSVCQRWACPGPNQGISDKDPTLAELLKKHGYVSGQFGKNHLGDRNEYLPTVHGFDEYAGVLYHLNALEEPENIDYPKDPCIFSRNIGPRDAIHTWATEESMTRPKTRALAWSASRRSRASAR